MAYSGRTSFAFSEILLRKTRVLPCSGEVVTKLGDLLHSSDIVAMAKRSVEPVVVSVGPVLGVPAKSVNQYLRRWAGESVQKGEDLAVKKGVMGLGRKVCKAPVSGIIVSGPHSSGEVVISPPDEELVVRAGVSGRVAGILPQRGAVVETLATYVQGVGGYGGEVTGTIQMAVQKPDGEIVHGMLDDRSAATVLVGGCAGLEAVIEAARVGVAALVVGGLAGEAYRWLLANRPLLVVVITDGAGLVPMTTSTFEILRQRAGMPALVTGSGEPEIVVALPGPHKAAGIPPGDLSVGTMVRIDAGLYGSSVGQITDRPAIPRRLPSGLTANIVEVTLEGGETVMAPRENLSPVA